MLTLCLCGELGTSLRAKPRRRRWGRPWTCTPRSVSGTVSHPHVRKAPGGQCGVAGTPSKGHWEGQGVLGAVLAGQRAVLPGTSGALYLLQSCSAISRSRACLAPQLRPPPLGCRAARHVLVSLVCLLRLLGPPSILLKSWGSCLLRFPWGAVNGTQSSSLLADTITAEGLRGARRLHDQWTPRVSGCLNPEDSAQAAPPRGRHGGSALVEGPPSGWRQR